MRVSRWMDELPPPNSSDPVHGGGTISKDEVILFSLGAPGASSGSDGPGCERPSPQQALGYPNLFRQQERAGRGPGWAIALFTLGPLLSLSLKPFLLSVLPSVAQDAPAFLYPCLPPILPCVLSVWSSSYSVQATLPISLILPVRLCYPPLLSLIHSLNKHL